MRYTNKDLLLADDIEDLINGDVIEVVVQGGNCFHLDWARAGGHQSVRSATRTESGRLVV